MKFTATPSQERLKQLFHFDPENGLFRRLRNHNRMKKGDIAGCVKKHGSGKSYVCLRVDGKQYKAHRLIFVYLYGSVSDLEVDHINGNGCDNRIENLRLVSARENQLNKRKHKTNTSGFNGVSFCRINKKWKAAIKVEGRSKTLGLFNSLIDAVAARISANLKYGFHVNHGSDRSL